jgi:hypothetical protein
MKGIRVVTAVIALVVLTVTSGPRGWPSDPVVSAAPNLSDLRGVDELKATFNHDAGKIRLVLLVSPT